MKQFFIPLVIAAFVNIILGILALEKKKIANYLFFLIALGLSLWNFIFGLLAITSDSLIVLLRIRQLNFVTIFIPALFLLFSKFFPENDYKISKYNLLLILAPWLLIMPFSFSKHYIASAIMTPLGVDFRYGPIYILFLLYFAGYMIYGLVILTKKYLCSRGYYRYQIGYVFVGTAITFVISIVVDSIMPLMGFKEFTPMGPISTISVVGCISYAIVRHHLMDIRLAITKVTIFFIIYLSTFVIPFYVGHKTQSWILSTLCMAILATLGPIVHRQLQAKAENVLLAKQKRYQKFLLSSARGMIQEHDLTRLMRLTVYVIKRSVKPKFVGIFLKQESGSYCLEAWRDHSVVPKDLIIPSSHRALLLLQEKRCPLMLENIARLLPELPLTPHFIVPAFNDKELLGFMVLGEKEDASAYTEDDSDVFSILSSQAALAIDNCLYIEAFKRNQQRLFEAEKLASIGGMAAGMSHQFKNRLNAFFQIAGGLASVGDYLKKKFPELYLSDPQFKDNIEYFDKCTEDVTKEGKRCTALVQGIIGFARDKASLTVQEFSLLEIIESSIYLVKVKHQCLDSELPFEFIIDIGGGEKLFTIKSHVNEIIFNMLDNAFESIEEKIKYRLSPQERKLYSPVVKIALTKREDCAIISVSDNGIGIKDEDKPKIFAPFFTTKSSMISGMGMGMYIIKRMVTEQMQGKMWFESEYQKGTSFYIELPKANA